MIRNSVINKIKDIAGAGNSSDAQEDRICYSYDGTPLCSKLPDLIVFPPTTGQISQIVKLANEEHFAIVPRGAGTGLSGGSIPVDDSIVLVMTRWNNILELDPANLTALTEPGVITAKLQQEVESKGLFYPPDPGSAQVCTIGGNVAENAGGLRGLKYGVTKNYVLGLEMVMPNGEILFSGGKNFKDVAGYNLRDLIVGSEGTLGIITKILLRLIPKPSHSITMLAFFDRIIDSGNAVSGIIASHITPSMIEFLDRTTINCVEDYTHIGLPRNAESLLLIEVDGRESVVQDEAATIIEILKRNRASSIRTAKTSAEADELKKARRTAFSALARQKPTTILEDATVPRSELTVMIEKIIEASGKFNIPIGNFGHAGDGNLHPTALTDEKDKAEILRSHRAFEFIFNEAVKLGGTITGEHGVGLSKKEFLESAVGSIGLDFMRKIKQTIDPQNVINPGKILTSKPRCEGKLPN